MFTPSTGRHTIRVKYKGRVVTNRLRGGGEAAGEIEIDYLIANIFKARWYKRRKRCSSDQ